LADSRNVAQTTPASTLRHRIFGALARSTSAIRGWCLDSRHCWQLRACSHIRARVLEFHTGQDDLISPSGRDSVNYFNYTREFPDLDGLIVVVKAQPSPARAELFADALGQRLAADRANVKSVFYRIDPGMMGNRRCS